MARCYPLSHTFAWCQLKQAVAPSFDFWINENLSPTESTLLLWGAASLLFAEDYRNNESSDLESGTFAI